MSARSSATSNANASATTAAEQRARDFLARGKWRKARDEIKPLVKADPDRFLPLLIQANMGLVREMLAKGQTSEARQVMDYLATIASPEQLTALKLDLTTRTGSGPDASATRRIVLALTDPNAVIPEEERQRMADALVLAFQPLATEGEAQARLAAEVASVQDALRAVAEAGWSHVSETLRAVPSRSPLRHWVMLVKGLAAFYTGDPARAAQCFQGLTGPSAPARAAEVFRWLLPEPLTAPRGDEKNTVPTEALLERAAILLGSAGAGSLLLQADQAWNEGRPVDSYRVLRTGLRSFPSDAADTIGALSEFYFHAPRGLPEKARHAYLRHFRELIDRDKHKPSAERMLALRMVALAEGRAQGADELRECWENYLAERAAVRGANPRFASLADTWLGQQLAPTDARGPECDCPECRAEYGDPEGAVAVLMRAIQQDQDNRAAHLTLATVYRTLKKSADLHRLLDVMAARFSTDKDVLLAAARGCIDRKAFVKGLNYIMQARLIDPLDPSLPELEASAQRRLARQHFQQGKPDKARQMLERLEPFLNDQPQDFQRSRWTARLRHGLMEKLWGDEGRAEALLAEARAAAPRADVFLLFAHLAHRVDSNTRNHQSPFRAEFQQELGRTPTVGAIASMLRVIDYWKNSPEQPIVRDEEQLVSRALRVAASQPFARTELVEVIERIQHLNEGRELPRDCQPLIESILRGDPNDPLFRLYRDDYEDTQKSPEDRGADYQAILDEAARRQDDLAVQRAREKIRELNRAEHAPWDDDFDESDGDDDGFPFPRFFGAEEDEDDANKGVPAFPIPGATDSERAEMAMLLDALRRAPKGILREMRRTRPKEITAEMFDELVRIAKSGAFPPPVDLPQPRLPKSVPPPAPPGPKPEAKRAPPKPPPPPADPSQMNLF